MYYRAVIDNEAAEQSLFTWTELNKLHTNTKLHLMLIVFINSLLKTINLKQITSKTPSHILYDSSSARQQTMQHVCNIYTLFHQSFLFIGLQ